MSKRLQEILRFILTGGVCTVIEYAALYILKEWLHLGIHLSTAIAFLVSVAVNYILCVRWVFPAAKEGSLRAQLGFLITSGAGFVLNSLLMWGLTALFGEDAVLLSVAGFDLKVYMVNKVVTTGLVMVWNYFTKRWVLKG